MIFHISTVLVVLLRSAIFCFAKDTNVCETLDSNMGATFDITDLVRFGYKSTTVGIFINFTCAFRPANSMSYMITDGDLPCTKQVGFKY